MYKPRKGSPWLLFLFGTSLVWSQAGPSDPHKRITQVFGPYELKAGGLMQMPAGVGSSSFPEPIWLLGYKTEIIDAEGSLLQKDLHCHTMFRTFYTDAWKGKGMDSVPFKGLFSDGNTSELRAPEGFGIYYDPGEPIEFMPMFNNRTTDVVHASMRVTLDLVLDKNLSEPLKPLYGMIQSVTNPHLYMVEPGQDVREKEFRFFFDGRIHVMAVHIHPYGRSLELINESRAETVWKAVGQRNDSGMLERMPVYTSAKGYPIRSDERYRLRAIYDNPTDKNQDAMAGLFILFATEDGKIPQPTTPTSGDD